MLVGFESITYELSEEEIKKTVPAIKKNLLWRTGKELAITSKELISLLKADGIVTTGPRIRKIIEYLRNSKDFKKGPLLKASSKGYYRTWSKKEATDYLQSLHGRRSALDVLIKNTTKFIQENKLND